MSTINKIFEHIQERKAKSDLFRMVIDLGQECVLFANPTPVFDGWWRFQIEIQSQGMYTEYSYTHCYGGAVDLLCDLIESSKVSEFHRSGEVVESIFEAFDRIFKSFQEKQMLVEIASQRGASIYALAIAQRFGSYTGRLIIHTPRSQGIVMVNALTAAGGLTVTKFLNVNATISDIAASGLFNFDRSHVDAQVEQKIYENLQEIISSRCIKEAA